MRRTLLLSCALACLSCASGPMLLVYEIGDEAGAKRLRQLEAREAELLESYGNLRDKQRAEVDASKKEIQVALAADKLGVALQKLDALHRLFHPCADNVCDRRDPTKLEARMQYILEKEGWDNEEAFVRTSLDDLVRRADALREKKAYRLLLTHLKDIRYRVQFYGPQHKHLVALQKGLATQWIEDLVARADRLQASKPGAALFYILQARAVAGDAKETARSLELAKRSGALKRTIREQHALHVHLERAQDPLSKAATQALFKLERGSVRLSTRKTQRTRASLRVRASAPSYRVSARQGSDSFKYRDGTASKPNPKHKDLLRKRGISQGNHDRCKRTCGKPYVSCTFNMWDGSSKILAEDDKECASLQTSLAEVAKLNNQLATTPKTLQEPAYSRRSYSFTLHSHKGASTLDYRLSFARGGRPVTARHALSTELTDREHPAYSHRGGGVSARPKRVPTQSQVFAQMNQDAARWLQGELARSLEVYLARFLQSEGKDPVHRIDSLMLYHALATDGLPVKYGRELSRVSGVANAGELLR